MKYESTILKRLIDTYGVVGNPRYISEIIKEFIVRGKERFPNLFTYQADWLAHIDEFGLNPSYTVSYTGQSIYAPNTLERPVKSAILTGQTLVNLFNPNDITTSNTDMYMENGYIILPVKNHRYNHLQIPKEKCQMFEPGEKYTLWVHMLENVTENNDGETQQSSSFFLQTYDYSDSIVKTSNQGAYGCRFDNNEVGTKMCVFEMHDKETMETKSCGLNFDLQCYYAKTGGIQKLAIVILKGDWSNKELPFDKPFYGMQSVKLPVLTTTNADGTKTNILTVNEEVELRGIGDAQDELNLLTGEFTERVGEIVLNGSENWKIYGIFDSDGYSSFVATIPSLNNVYYNTVSTFISADFPTGSWVDYRDAVIDELIWNHDSNFIGIRVKNEKASNVNEIKSFLSTNNIRINYALASESIKTVDLSILDQNGQNVKQLMSFNGGTHFNTGSLEGSPLPSVSVSVETDLGETLRVCSLDGNTM